MSQVDLALSAAGSPEVAANGLGMEEARLDPDARGRLLARHAVEELIAEVRRRAALHQLDRGLRLSLPYYDDRRQALRWREFTVIPRGRILFVPAFVVLAAERERERVANDRQYTEPTRQHLLGLLSMLEESFRLARS